MSPANRAPTRDGVTRSTANADTSRGTAPRRPRPGPAGVAGSRAPAPARGATRTASGSGGGSARVTGSGGGGPRAGAGARGARTGRSARSAAPGRGAERAGARGAARTAAREPWERGSAGATQAALAAWVGALAQRFAAPEVLAGALVRARSGRRVAAVLVLYLLLSAGMAWRLVSLQVLSAEEYRELASQQTQREIDLPARRGKLVDREGQPLAMSLTAASVYVDPQTFAAAGADPDAVSAQVHGAIGDPGIDVARIRAALTSAEPFAYVARQIPREAGQRVVDLALPGIGIQEEPTRTYPSAPLAAPIIGRAGTDNVGLSGLELAYDGLLAGTPGTLRMERATNGVEISAAPRVAEPPVAGIDVILTIDREIQAQAESLLTAAVAGHQADGGSAVVLDAHTGEVLALATAAGAEDPDLRTRAITDVYEPGSVNKVITLSAAIEEGLVTPSTSMTIPDFVEIGGKRFRENHPPEDGRLTVSEVMARSSNVGTIQLAQLLGDDTLARYLHEFGYGRSTGLGFPGESGGIVNPVEDWTGTSLPTAAIGHGVSATLLQVADVFATIANDGEWIQPSLVRGTAGADGALVPGAAPERRRVVSEATADAVAEMLAGVVESEYGTGARAAIPGYRTGGKTGTAEKPKDGGYEAGANFASFAGFAPVEDPRYVVAVMIDEPRVGGSSGGVTAAPVFRDLLGFVLGHERVPPSPGVEPPAATAVPAPAPPPPAMAATAATPAPGVPAATAPGTAPAPPGPGVPAAGTRATEP